MFDYRRLAMGWWNKTFSRRKISIKWQNRKSATTYLQEQNWFLRGTSDFLHLFALLPPGRRLRGWCSCEKYIQWPEGNHSFWGAMGVLGHSKLWSFPNVKIPWNPRDMSDIRIKSYQNHLSCTLSNTKGKNHGAALPLRMCPAISRQPCGPIVWRRCRAEPHRVIMALWMRKLWERKHDHDDDDDDDYALQFWGNLFWDTHLRIFEADPLQLNTYVFSIFLSS